MSKFLMLGMPLAQVIARATVNAARVFPTFDDRGTLNIGAPADVTIMELREGTFEFVDTTRALAQATSGFFP
jgi:dihydroorotase